MSGLDENYDRDKDEKSLGRSIWWNQGRKDIEEEISLCQVA